MKETTEIAHVDVDGTMIYGDKKPKRRRRRAQAPQSDHTFDDDIPFPAARTGAGGIDYWRMREMKIGQSFFIAGETPRSVAGLLRAARKELGYQLQTRAANHDGFDGVRIWRKG